MIFTEGIPKSSRGALSTTQNLFKLGPRTAFVPKDS